MSTDTRLPKLTTELTVNFTIVQDNNVSSLCIPVSLSDGDNDLISRHTEFLITKFTAALYAPAIFLLGGPSNMANIIVFIKHGLRDRVNLCLFTLSVVDLISLSFYSLHVSEQMFFFQSRDVYGPFFSFLVNHKILLFYSFLYCSTFLTTVIAVERCLFVLFPLRASMFLSTKSMAAFLVIAVCIIGFLRLIVTAKYAVVCFLDIRTHVTFNDLYVTDYEVKNRLMLYIVDGIFYGFILSLGCPIVILIATAITSFKLWQSVVWKEQNSYNGPTKEKTVTKMLVMLSVKYMMITLPRILIRIVPLFYEDFSLRGRYRNFHLVSIRFSEALAYLGISLNFVVYYFVGTKFRATLCSLLPGKQTLRRQTLSSSSSRQHSP